MNARRDQLPTQQNAISKSCYCLRYVCFWGRLWFFYCGLNKSSGYDLVLETYLARARRQLSQTISSTVVWRKLLHIEQVAKIGSVQTFWWSIRQGQNFQNFALLRILHLGGGTAPMPPTLSLCAHSDDGMICYHAAVSHQEQSEDSPWLNIWNLGMYRHAHIKLCSDKCALVRRGDPNPSICTFMDHIKLLLLLPKLQWPVMN